VRCSVKFIFSFLYTHPDRKTHKICVQYLYREIRIPSGELRLAFVSLPLMVNPILKSSLAKVVSTGNVTTPLGVAERATTVAYKGDELLRLYLLFIIHYFLLYFC